MSLTHYQEVTILPNTDIDGYFIWKNVFNQLHIAMADTKNKYDVSNIAVSFPEYTKSYLGHKLRVFGKSESDLKKLNLQEWFEDFLDYVHLKKIAKVPTQLDGHLLVKRYRSKSPEEKIAELAKHHNSTYEEALAKYQERENKLIQKNYPFIWQKSKSNGRNYRLIIWQEPVNEAKDGSFNSFGLNGMTGTATVPNW